MPVDTILIKNTQYTHSPMDRMNIGHPRKIHRDAPPTNDRPCLDGLYSVFTTATAAAAAVVVSVVVVDDDDYDKFGMYIIRQYFYHVPENSSCHRSVTACYCSCTAAYSFHRRALLC
jgi:hypothetical protein